MIEVRRHHAEALASGQAGQHIGESHRVGAAGKGHHQGVAGRRRPESLEGPRYRRFEGSQLQERCASGPEVGGGAGIRTPDAADMSRVL